MWRYELMPDYAEEIELIAEMIVNPSHACGPDCMCFQLRELAGIKKAIRQLECQQAETGQAIVAAATGKIGKGIGKTVGAIARNPRAIATAPIRLGARATEAAANQKLVPLRPLLNIMTPADEAEAAQFKVPGRDVGLPPKVEPVFSKTRLGPDEAPPGPPPVFPETSLGH
jgi:hypothetical protein